MSPVRLAVVGTGNWARSRHYPALDYIRHHGLFDLHCRGICSLDHQEAKDLAERHAFERVYRDLDELVADDELDAIAIMVHPAALKGVVEKLVGCGLPLFSEKPPGRTHAEAVGLAELVTQPNLIALNRRFNPLNNRFKDIVAAMDSPYFVEAHFLRHNRRDEPFAIETGIHIVNLLEYICGPIQTVRTEIFANPLNPTHFRLSRLGFSSGMEGLLKVFPCSGANFERLEVHSNELSAFLHGPFGEDSGRILLHRQGQHGLNAEEILPQADSPLVVEQGFVGEYCEFFALVQEGKPSRSTFQNAVSSMRAAEAIHNGVDM
jgi:predicted dehydrogenase